MSEDGNRLVMKIKSTTGKMVQKPISFIKKCERAFNLEEAFPKQKGTTYMCIDRKCDIFEGCQFAEEVIGRTENEPVKDAGIQIGNSLEF